MSDLSQGEVTQLLKQWSAGRASALDDLLPLVYRELKAMAARRLRRERADHTLQATDLVHEAFLRLVGQHNASWNDRAHFFAIAAQAMRRVLVDHARRTGAEKRISPSQKVPLDAAPPLSSEPDVSILEVDQALERLTAVDERQARVVELRFFGGLTVAETAEVMSISEATVAREWRMARAWLRREIERGSSGGQ
jgi:RNA polymerase sigma factor (TIGR02999 family)